MGVERGVMGINRVVKNVGRGVMGADNYNGVGWVMSGF